MQIVFVLALLFALVVVGVLASKATGERILILQDAMSDATNHSKSSMQELENKAKRRRKRALQREKDMDTKRWSQMDGLQREKVLGEKKKDKEEEEEDQRQINQIERENRAIWKAYSTCEAVFLFPILLIVFVVSVTTQKCCVVFQVLKKKNKYKKSTVVPSKKELDDARNWRG